MSLFGAKGNNKMLLAATLFPILSLPSVACSVQSYRMVNDGGVGNYLLLRPNQPQHEEEGHSQQEQQQVSSLPLPPSPYDDLAEDDKDPDPDAGGPFEHLMKINMMP